MSSRLIRIASGSATCCLYGSGQHGILTRAGPVISVRSCQKTKNPKTLAE
uniref:Uncharacterized protein n=1 Tax=Picea sitchensis TaxID=3332 RepID=D5ADD8_PICSI|nr:unknown [Picea sitchensis]